MNSSTKFILVAIGIVLIGLGLGNWYLARQNPTDVAHEQIVQQPAPTKPPAAQPKPPSHYPVTPDSGTQPALPALEVSDTAIRNALVDLLGAKIFTQFFNASEIIKRLVVSIDNLPRDNVSLQTLPLKLPGGQFQVRQTDNLIVLSDENFKRYTPYITLIDGLDAKKMVALYKYFYPLFQQQYRELGYPDGYFNDRLIVVIDHMINAPDLVGPAPLVQKHVQYQYANPEQEHMSAGQKLLIRIGPDNAMKVKAKLREIRAALVS